MTSSYKILPFSSYVVRTPLLPLSFYLDLLENFSFEKAVQIYQMPLVKEALSLASPDLIKELDKWSKRDSGLSDQKAKKLEITFLKYIARMSSRCTPFGLFAGCSLGEMASETSIILEDFEKFQRVTQFDMQFWVALLQQIAVKKDVLQYLKYYPNNSIYKIGDFYRYIEYKYVETRREHSISAFRKSEILEELLFHTKAGMTVEEMISILAENENEKEEAFDFVLNLINAQFLISELDVVATGRNEWERVFSILNKIVSIKKEFQFLENLQKQISDLDLTLTPSEKIYDEIKSEINKNGFVFDEKYLFQTDLNTVAAVNLLNINTSKKVIQALYFLNGTQIKEPLRNLQKFKEAFVKRYESRSMPLNTVLDTETGIGYLQNQDLNDTNEILEHLSLVSKRERNKNQLWTNYDFVLQKKLQECVFNNEKVIELTEKDFADFDNDLKNVPLTFSVMLEVFGQDQIAIESSGDVSAAKLLGRFCNGNSAIHDLANEIIKKEEQHYSDKIMAEVVHIPQSRTGNIICRPTLREYEIAYLTKPGVPENKNIDLNDLWISVVNDTLLLYSKKYDKEVIPCLSNAHDFSKDSLPIYHFLCDLQAQHAKPIYSFSWGILEKHYDFFPRVYFQDIIISKARWIITKEEIKGLLEKSDKNSSEEFLKWRFKRNIPQYVNWINTDNTLLFDFETQIGVKLFLKTVQNKTKIILEEFLFTEKSVVQNKTGDNFCNQFILSFYKE